MKTLKEQAAEMLKRCETVVVASVNNGGFPRPVPMSKIHSEGYAEVWMATGKDSLKTRDFARKSESRFMFFRKREQCRPDRDRRNYYR